MHPLTTIAEEGLMPVSAPSALSSGASTSLAGNLLEVFSNTTEGTSKVEFITSCASLSLKEWQEGWKQALKRSTKQDKQAGFVAAEDAKGSDKYGKREKCMRSQASQASVLWGAIKQALLVPSEGFVAEVKNARKALDDAGVTWKGEHAPTKDEQEIKAAVALEIEAIAAARMANPGTPLLQLEEAILAQLEGLQADAQDTAADKLVKHLEKQDLDVAALASIKFLSKHTDLTTTVQALQSGI